MARKKKRIRQLELPLATWGGARKGAGRKPIGPKPRVAHDVRPALSPSHPVLVTLRLRECLPSLRRPATLAALERAFAASAGRFGFHLVHYSIQTNHLHLIAEARDRRALARGMQGLLVRAARALNRMWRRRGIVFADHYHARALSTPREVRNALAYVLCNVRRHGVRGCGPDEYSSGPWFNGWAGNLAASPLPPPVAEASTWLMRVGWRRHGSIGLGETPGPLGSHAPRPGRLSPRA